MSPRHNPLISRAALVLATTAALWWPPVQASPVAPTATAALAGQQMVGSSLYRYWGFEVYTATLHAAPGFDGARFEQQPLALELQYRRAFEGRDIAQRSIDEMQAIAPLSAAQSREWLSTMAALFPDVKPGDRLLGVHVPGSGARFYFNGTLRGTVDDPVFSSRFFGIWLSPKTSAPQLRDALLARNPR